MRSYYNVYLRAVVDRLENLVDINAQSSVPEFLIDWLPVSFRLFSLFFLSFSLYLSCFLLFSSEHPKFIGAT